MTRTRRRSWTLVVMAAVEVIYLVAATLWIGVVSGTAFIGVRVMMRLRARRRRINRLLAVLRLPVPLGRREARTVRWRRAGWPGRRRGVTVNDRLGDALAWLQVPVSKPRRR